MYMYMHLHSPVHTCNIVAVLCLRALAVTEAFPQKPKRLLKAQDYDLLKCPTKMNALNPVSNASVRIAPCFP